MGRIVALGSLNIDFVARVPNLLRAVDILVVNETEAAELVGHPVHDVQSAAAVAATAASARTRTVIFTLGAAGAVLCRDAETFHVKPFQVQAVDTAAAGDAFVGALAVALVGEGIPVGRTAWGGGRGGCHDEGRRPDIAAMPTGSARPFWRGLEQYLVGGSKFMRSWKR